MNPKIAGGGAANSSNAIMQTRHIKWGAILLALLSLAVYYFSAETFRNPVTGEESRVGLSRDQEQALGLQGFQEVISGARTIDSGPEYEMVGRVAQRLTHAVGQDGADLDWEVALVDSPEANAFCLPGGKIVIYTGILPTARDEAGLATVMGHEIAHAIARHGAQRVFEQGAIQIAVQGLQEGLSDLSAEQRQTIMGLFGAGAQYGVVLPFSREHELEADRMGLVYMARAGYDPEQAVDFWKRMAASAGAGRPIELMSTHPSDSRRIQAIGQHMAEALEEYRRARQRDGDRHSDSSLLDFGRVDNGPEDAPAEEETQSAELRGAGK
ncbi:MAG: M48 family metallopeptidase [Leptospirales bacterium]|nr:M48 family metallopeptidase [Leptospirales bacterium]